MGRIKDHFQKVVPHTLKPVSYTHLDVYKRQQLQALKAAGYAGFVSMEPFSPVTQQDPHILTRIRKSLDLVG